MTEHKIAFSVDLDDWYHMSYITGTPDSRYNSIDDFLNNWKGRFDMVTRPTIELLEILYKKNIKATFFVNAHMIDIYPEMMNALKDSGHEIANHSYYHTIAIAKKTKDSTISQAAWKNEVDSAKIKINDFFHQNPLGYRAPNIYITDWMLDYLIEQGYKYDASLANNILYDKTNLRISEIPRRPFLYYHTKEKSKSIMELPGSNFKVSKTLLPGGGSFFFRFFGKKYFSKLLHQQLKIGDTMFYIHPFELSNEPIPIRNKKSWLYWVNKGDKTKKSLLSLFDNFEGRWSTCKEVYEKNINIKK
jgi:peptidoglycan/xylan/chitin deacetylase (PgdA/CDA1 family)